MPDVLSCSGSHAPSPVCTAASARRNTSIVVGSSAGSTRTSSPSSQSRASSATPSVCCVDALDAARRLATLASTASLACSLRLSVASLRAAAFSGSRQTWHVMLLSLTDAHLN